MLPRSWNVLSREPFGDRIATSCRHTAPDLTARIGVKDRIAKSSLSQYVLGFWGPSKPRLHALKSSKQQHRDRKTIFETLSLRVAKILSPVARQVPTKCFHHPFPLYGPFVVLSCLSLKLFLTTLDRMLRRGDLSQLSGTSAPKPHPTSSDSPPPPPQPQPPFYLHKESDTADQPLPQAPPPSSLSPDFSSPLLPPQIFCCPCLRASTHLPLPMPADNGTDSISRERACMQPQAELLASYKRLDAHSHVRASRISLLAMLVVLRWEN